MGSLLSLTIFQQTLDEWKILFTPLCKPFLHCFFLSIISFNILKNKDGFLKSSSYFIVIFGILDNFGFGGGGMVFLILKLLLNKTPHLQFSFI